MLLWLSIPLILLLIVLIYYIWNRKSVVKEKFQNQYDEDTPPINLNVTVSPTLLNAANEILSTIINEDMSGSVIPATDADPNCIILQNQLQNYNSELQRHRNEGNWSHTHAIRSYIDITSKQLIASGCQTN